MDINNEMTFIHKPSFLKQFQGVKIMFLPPKQIIYAVGKNIEIVEYYVLVAFDIPEKKSERKIETNDIIQSLTTASSVAYFANVEESSEFSTKNIVSN